MLRMVFKVKRLIRVAGLLIIVALCVSLFSGCGTEDVELNSAAA